jgi:hyperosmotically inducible periplasmic protein
MAVQEAIAAPEDRRFDRRVDTVFSLQGVLILKEACMRCTRYSRWAAALLVAVAVGCGQTDPGITTAIKSKLAADDQVKAYEIDVDTKEKVVTLTGNVDTAIAKSRAVELATNPAGVTRVVDNLTVADATAAAPPSVPDAAQATLSDPALTGAIKTALLADGLVKGLKIDVDARDAVVTLTGDVRSQAERDRALQIARDTPGVKDVQDRLRMNP